MAFTRVLESNSLVLPGFSVPMGLLTPGISIAAMLMKLLPKWLTVMGMVFGACEGLSWPNFVGGVFDSNDAASVVHLADCAGIFVACDGCRAAFCRAFNSGQRVANIATLLDRSFTRAAWMGHPVGARS